MSSTSRTRPSRPSRPSVGSRTARSQRSVTTAYGRPSSHNGSRSARLKNAMPAYKIDDRKYSRFLSLLRDDNVAFRSGGGKKHDDLYIPQTAQYLAEYKSKRAQRMRRERLQRGQMSASGILRGVQYHQSTNDATTANITARSFHMCPLAIPDEYELPPKRFNTPLRRAIHDSDYWSALLPNERNQNDMDAKERDTMLLRAIERHRKHAAETAARASASSHDGNGSSTSSSSSMSSAHRLKSGQVEAQVDIMSLLDHELLGSLREEFLEKPLSLAEFVDILIRYLPRDLGVGEVKLAASLCNFFSDVDVNGDGSMEWHEFTNFIIDRGMARSATTTGVVDTIDHYQLSSLDDKNKHVNPIEKVVYLAELDHLIVIEKSSHSFTVINGQTLKQVAKVHGHKRELTSVEYLHSYRWVVSSSSDCTLRFWDPYRGYKPVHRSLVPTISTKTIQMNLNWAASLQCLYASTNDNNINCWRIRKEHSKAFVPEILGTLKGHEGVVLDTLLLPGMQHLASASMDGTIGLWDVNTQQMHHVLKGHKRGVFQLAYNEQYHCLVSAGYDHSAIVWNPYIGKVTCKLKGHYNPLVSLQAVQNSPQIVTADQGGLIKVWDIRTYACVQTIHVDDDHDERARAHLSSMVSLSHHRRLVSASNKLHVHDSITSIANRHPSIADNLPSMECIFNKHFASFISASGGIVKTWNGVDGSLQNIFRDLNAHEITALCLDDSHKKFIIGNAQGEIKIYNYLNGHIMKTTAARQHPVDGKKALKFGRDAYVKQQLPKRRDIATLHYVPGMKHIIATSRDGRVALYDETKEDSLPLVKSIQHHRGKAETCCSTFSHNLALFASGSSNGEIQLWDYRLHVPSGELRGHSVEITSLCFLDPFPLLASADGDGNLCVWAVRPVGMTTTMCLMRIVNTNVGKGHVEPKPSPITSMFFWHDNTQSLLFTGGVGGHIKRWDISGALARWGLGPFTVGEQSQAPPTEQKEKEDEEEQAAVSAAEAPAEHKEEGSEAAVAVAAVEEHNIASSDAQPEHLDHPTKEEKKETSGVSAAPHHHHVGSLILEYEKYRQAHAAAISKLEAVTKARTAQSLQEGDVALTKQWEAHTDSIREIHAVADPETSLVAVVSCGFDKHVRLWDLDSNCIGKFQQGRVAGTRHAEGGHWTFTPDMSGRRAQAQEQALLVLEQLQVARLAAQHHPPVERKRGKPKTELQQKEEELDIEADIESVFLTQMRTKGPLLHTARSHFEKEKKKRIAEGKSFFSTTAVGLSAAGRRPSHQRRYRNPLGRL